MIDTMTTGILAHVDAGKTTLSEALLYKTGLIRNLGRVDDKNSFLDTDLMERERGITIYSKNARIKLGDKTVILVDTPGHVDFSAEMERTLGVLDVAILLISASEGIQSHTRTLWKLLKAYKIPCCIFVNKIDMQDVNSHEILSKIQSELTPAAVSFENTGTDEFYENIASCDELLMEEYLEEGNLNVADKIKKENIIRAIGERNIVPVFFGSALKLIGIDEFIKGLEEYMVPSYISHYNTNKNVSDEFGAKVYKILHDKQGKKITFLKITSGSLKVKDVIGEEKVNELRVYSGEKYESVREVHVGEICGVYGLENSKSMDVYGAESGKNAMILAPVLNYAVNFPEGENVSEMLKIFRKIEDEDPALMVNFSEETGEISVSLMGEIQAEVLTEKIEREYNVKIAFVDGKIKYKETIEASAEGVGHFEPLRHYAEVHIKLEPLERGSGMLFETDLGEDLLDKNWQRLILTHMMEREHRGVLIGSPITDIKMTLVAGKAHIKHTEGGDFRQATYRAIRQGLMQLREMGKCKLLEPYYSYTIELPSAYVGRAMTDITGMCGTSTIAENDYENDITILTGTAPVKTMNGYSKELMSYTKGLGKLSLIVAGYDECHDEEEILSNTRYNPENDVRNTPDSVFCSHGSGTVIPWYEVENYMHLSYSYEGGQVDRSEKEILDKAKEANRIRREREEKTSDFIATSEIDSILLKSSYANSSKKDITHSWNLGKTEQRKPDKQEDTYVYKPVKHKDRYLIVDGYNVIHAWEELKHLFNTNMDGATGALNDILCNYQAMDGSSLIVVYDAYKIKGHITESIQYSNIEVVYTKEGQTADQYIERFVNQNINSKDITVVTSDSLERSVVYGLGAHVIASQEFEKTVKIKCHDFYEKYGVK